MTVKKIVNTLISKLIIDLTQIFQGIFGDYPSYIDCRFFDLMIIAKIIHNNTLLQQINKAYRDFNCRKIKCAISDLYNLTNKVK